MTSIESLPPVLVAVTVYTTAAEVTVGVPLISPVEVEKVRPVGSDGEIDQVTTAPPFTVGVDALIATSLVSV